MKEKIKPNLFLPVPGLYLHIEILLNLEFKNFPFIPLAQEEYEKLQVLMHDLMMVVS